MNLIHHSKILIPPNRHRKKFDAAQLEELKNSILALGLLQLPVMRHAADGFYELVAGERRLRSMLLIYAAAGQFKYGEELIDVGMIPYHDLNEVDYVVAREVELHENIKRSDLTWQERINAIAELHKLKAAQDPSWNLTQTASTANIANVTSVSNAVLLSENLHRPDVRAATSEGEAMKVLVRELEREFAGELGRRQMQDASEKYIVTLGEAVETLIASKETHYEVILTDPPYGIGADTFQAHLGGGGAATSHTYSDDWTSVSKMLDWFARVAFNVAAESAHLYLFCDIRRFLELQLMFEIAGWKVWKTPLIWYKGSQGIAPDPLRGPRRTYEAILFASKGDRKVTGVGDDVLSFPRDKDTVHAAQKPVDLYVELLRRSIMTPGSWVLDPFCGSGTIFPAAAKLGLCARGIDSDPACVQMSRERIAKL